MVCIDWLSIGTHTLHMACRITEFGILLAWTLFLECPHNYFWQVILSSVDIHAYLTNVFKFEDKILIQLL